MTTQAMTSPAALAASMSSTDLPTSRVVASLPPEARRQLKQPACIHCQNAVWQDVSKYKDKGAKQVIQIYCRLLSVVIDGPMQDCDGWTAPESA